MSWAVRSSSSSAMSKKKRRDCPAVGRQITAAECGENRISRYDCPESCPYNPFRGANFEELVELERAVDERMMKRAVGERDLGFEVERLLEKYQEGDPALDWGLIHALTVRRGDDGLTVVERWERDGWDGLRNDGRVIMEGQRETRPMLIEVQEVGEQGRIYFIDCLEGEGAERRLMVDTDLAGRLCRFDLRLCLMYPMPHYYRCTGVPMEMPRVPGYAPRQALEELVGHLGGKLERDWMLQHADRLLDAVAVLGGERQRLALLGSQLASITVDYKLKEKVSVVTRKLERAGCWEDPLREDELDEGYQLALLWPADEEWDDLAETWEEEPYLGTVLLKAGQARLRSIRRDAMEALQEAFEDEMGDAAEFERSLERDVARQHADKMGKLSVEMVPGPLREAIALDPGLPIEELKTLYSTQAHAKGKSLVGDIEAIHRKLLDTELERLGGRTPRQAVKDAALKPAVVDWLKELFNHVDRGNLYSGESIQVNWMARELGLHEVDFPPPPPREIPEEQELDWGEDEDYEQDDVYGDAEDEHDDEEDFLPFPGMAADDEEDESYALLEEYERRIQQCADEFGEAAQLLSKIEESGCNLIEEADRATRRTLSEEGFNVCGVILAMAWRVLAWKGESVVLGPGDLKRHMAVVTSLLEEVVEQGASEAFSRQLLSASRQPELLLLLWDRLKMANEDLPPSMRPSSEEYPAMMALIMAAVNALDEAMG